MSNEEELMQHKDPEILKGKSIFVDIFVMQWNWSNVTKRNLFYVLHLTLLIFYAVLDIILNNDEQIKTDH